MRKLLAGGLMIVLAACANPAPGSSPSASAPRVAASAAATPTPPPPAEPAVALVDWDQTGSSYTLSLVSAAAKVVASVHATWSRGGRCGSQPAGIIAPQPVSTSNSRAYYLDSGSLKWVQGDGKAGVAFAGPLDTGGFKVYGFAVAPDDKVFALNTIDYSGATVHQSLTVTKVGGTSLGREIYSASSSSSAAVWPAGWHNGYLVLAYHGGTCTQGGGPGLADAWSYHVVDAQTADRRATIGSDNRAACGFVGYPTRAGVACGSYLETGGRPQTQVLDWTGAFRSAYGAGFLPGGLSPDGNAYLGNTSNGSQFALTLVRAAGNAPNVPVGDCFACGVMWIDNTHFVVVPNGAGQVKVFASSPEPLQGVPVEAQGIPAARIPGGLDGA